MTTKDELEATLRERDRRIVELKAELEVGLRERDRRIAELKAENGKQADLIRRQREKLDEAGVVERSATGAERPQMGRLLKIIQANPGLTAVEIHSALAKRSWAAQRFGKWAAMFGPTYGAMYVALAQLARNGSVNVNRGEATEERRKGRRRPLRFYARRTHATEPYAKSAVVVLGDVAAVEERSATGAERARSNKMLVHVEHVREDKMFCVYVDGDDDIEGSPDQLFFYGVDELIGREITQDEARGSALAYAEDLGKRFGGVIEDRRD
jgi:hypothetical protein